MQINELYKELVEAYQQENMNSLSSDLISLYRGNDLNALRKVHALIYNGDQAADEQISRIFARIIMHYHPDRIEQINKQLNAFLDANDLNGMRSLEHILDVQAMDMSRVYSGSSIDHDFDAEDIWDYSAGGYSYIDDEERDLDEYEEEDYSTMGNGFIAAVKRMIYGHLNVEFPVHQLADMEIIEMAEYEIEDLDGIEYCTYARILDLSDNNLSEVTQLAHLMRLEEVFLQNNHISYLDGLNNLPYLRVLDVSNNELNDLSPLFEIDTLEFVNVIGNKIPAWQLEKLSLAGVVVVS